MFAFAWKYHLLFLVYVVINVTAPPPSNFYLSWTYFSCDDAHQSASCLSPAAAADDGLGSKRGEKRNSYQGEIFKVSKLADAVFLWLRAWMDLALLLGVLGSFAQLQRCFNHFSAVALFFCLSNGVKLLFRGCCVSVGVWSCLTWLISALLTSNSWRLGALVCHFILALCRLTSFY